MLKFVRFGLVFSVISGILQAAQNQGGTMLVSYPAEKDAPTICTVGEGEAVKKRVEEYRSVFKYLEKSDRFENGFRWTFKKAKGVEDKLAYLAKMEHECCRFFGISVLEKDSKIVWECVSEPKAAPVLDEFSRLPETLKDGALGEEALEGLSEKAGLIFRKPSLWERFCNALKAVCP